MAKQTIKLTHGKWSSGRPRETEAAQKLREAADKTGTMEDMRKGGWSNYQVLRRLAVWGLVEVRNSGPRGGRRYHATRAGRYQIKKLNSFKKEATG